MRGLRLNEDTLEDVFRHGRKVTTIVQDYQNYSISIGYRWDENKKQYVITSVRLYKREGGEKIMNDFEEKDIVSRYTQQQAVEDGVLVEILKINWPKLSGGRPILA